uniref:Uncharacterized protein n=1 Tax=Hemiselmis tepida TaxID=464990 RepID=A0A7S0W5N0_9CRYP|mmetsp:Transcript_4624/g.11956  ORF Transcript_4624/g.11956 Transcript_4624/m.11956 type:complete len:119 (+) Transcript_4624:64-420(+)
MSCSKWADCKCALHGDTCDCGEGCKCGTITHEAMAEFKKTACPWSDCKCGVACGCGSTCNCVGKTPKTDKEWAAAAKGAAAGPPAGECPWSDCSCKAANQGKCGCGAACKCGSAPVAA